MPGRWRVAGRKNPKWNGEKFLYKVDFTKSRDATLRTSNKPEHYRMKRLIAEVMYQVLVELLSQMLLRLAEWLAVVPWL